MNTKVTPALVPFATRTANRRGFTLVEILVVLGLLGILFSFCAPGYNRFCSNLFLSASAKSVASALRHTQSQALLQHQAKIFSLEKAGLPGQIKIIKASKISFSSSGSPPPGGSGTITLGNRLGKNKKIIVSSAGRVRIE